MVKNTRYQEPILRVEGLSKVYYSSSFGGERCVVALKDVFFSFPGETLGIVGESGCGKSTLGKTLLRLIEPTAGSVFFEGTDLFHASPAQMKRLRRHMQIVFQDPYASLNPRMIVGDIVGEPLKLTGEWTDRNWQRRVLELLETVGLDPSCFSCFPNEFSGGQRQRICIARALALHPHLIICDEPVSALDVSIRSQILNLLCRLQQELSLTYLFISHDLSVIHHVSDRICVMYLGQIVEFGTTEQVYLRPLHPYTRCLLSSVLSPVTCSCADAVSPVIGEPSIMTIHDKGCSFRSRCQQALEICAWSPPPMYDIDGHQVRCYLYAKNGALDLQFKRSSRG